MEETDVELDQLLSEEKLENVPLLVLANRQDLISASSAEDISDGLNLPSIRNRSCTIQPCSAKKGEGLQEGMEWVVEKVNESNDKARYEKS
mmetsp:Transcript_4626/g.4773  ORF Transcript_4626/g.4773 Transcript_4626/m.4773 type:complete len:91 (-) Transcript_4626:132-404(-)